MGQRPHHLEPRLVALVGAGGTLGTAARHLVGEWLPERSGWPVGTLLVNVLGAFLLGALLEALLRRGRESVRGRNLRLALGTGVLGGFTTFSALAVELERLLAERALDTALGYALASTVLGLAACALGVVVAAAGHRRWALPRDPDEADQVVSEGEHWRPTTEPAVTGRDRRGSAHARRHRGAP